jgi:hypothetical protein
MNRPKIMLLGLIAVMSALAVSAAPASAEFGSLIKLAHGQAKALSAIVIADGGTAIECPAGGSEIEWKIQEKGEIGKQKEAVEGPHLSLGIKWPSKGCVLKSETLKEKVAVTISECALQLVQTGTETSSLGAVEKACIAKSSPCEITIPAANEKSSENFALKNNTLQDKGPDLEVNAADTGVTLSVKGALCPIKSNKEAKISGAIEAEQVVAAPAKWESPTRGTLYSGDAWAKSTTAGIKLKDTVPFMGEEETATCQLKTDFNVENAPTRGLSNWITPEPGNTKEINYTACTTTRANCTVSLTALNVPATTGFATMLGGVTADTILRLSYSETILGGTCVSAGTYTVNTERTGCLGTWTNPAGGEAAFAVFNSQCLRIMVVVAVKLEGTVRFRAGRSESATELFLE